MKKHILQFLRDQAGVALVEAALTLPMLIVLSLVIFEYSFVFWQHQVVTSGVRDAARYLARVPIDSSSTCGAAMLATLVPGGVGNATYLTYAQDIALHGDIAAANGGVPAFRVPQWSSTPPNFSVSVSCVADPLSGNLPAYRGGVACGASSCVPIVTVTVSYVYQDMGILTGFGFADPGIAVAHSERWIGG
jgi:hypothetical protein